MQKVDSVLLGNVFHVKRFYELYWNSLSYCLIVQTHDFYLTVGAYGEAAAMVQLACVLEAAFLHYAPAGLVVEEMVGPKGAESPLAEAVVNEQL